MLADETNGRKQYKKFPMSHQVTVENREKYLYFKVTGENSPETIGAYMKDIVELCRKHDCFRILINECLTGPRLPTMDVFNVASEGAMQLLGQFDAIAYVDAQMGDMGDFVESVAVNRGMPLAFFSDIREAEEWIRDRPDGADEQYIFWKGPGHDG